MTRYNVRHGTMNENVNIMLWRSFRVQHNACLCPVKAKRPQNGAPALELVQPVGKGALGDEDDVWPADALALEHVGENADALQGLTQAHLVRKNTFGKRNVIAQVPIVTNTQLYDSFGQ